MTRSMNVDIDTIQDAWEISGFHGGFSGTPGWIKQDRKHVGGSPIPRFIPSAILGLLP